MLGRVLEAALIVGAVLLLAYQGFWWRKRRYEDYPRRCFMASAERAGRENR